MALTESLLAFIDTETTGLTAADEVIELACILTDMNLQEVGRWQGKFKPACPVHPQAAAINGYDADTWEQQAVPFGHFIAWCKPPRIPLGHAAVPVGHNVIFDQPRIEAAFKAQGAFCPISRRGIDSMSIALTLRLAGVLRCENVKLPTVAEALGVCRPTHRAMDDAETVRAILGRAVQLLGPQALARMEPAL
jgi:DNA polymerase III epsilon subunit-like protein